MRHCINNIVDAQAISLRSKRFGVSSIICMLPCIADILIEINSHHDSPTVIHNTSPMRESPAFFPRSVIHESSDTGNLFPLGQIVKYMEGLGYGVNPEIAKRLHRGDFSIQVHLDLHWLGVGEAHEAFEGFLKEALLAGNRAVLVIHGRGRSSRAEPVLKTKVREWLTSGPWRKWVIAFTSARACDGGAGATYVLLRQRPATKRYRKGATKE